MKRFSLIALFISLFVAVAFAVDSLVPVDTIIKNVTAVADAVKDVKTGGTATLLLLVAIVNLLMNLMKFKPVAGYLNTDEMKKVKPYIAVVLGIAGGLVESMLSGNNLTISIVSGIIAGTGAIGIHELSHAKGLLPIFEFISSLMGSFTVAKAKEEVTDTKVQ